LRKQAGVRARALADAGHWRVVAKLPVPACDRAAFDAAVKQVRRRARGALAPVAAAEAVGWALDLPFAEALAKERATAVELRGGPQCKALRHIFHADRVAARLPESTGRAPGAWPIRHVGVIGGGTMGSGIAIALLEAGLQVTLVETSINAAAAAEARIRAVHARQIGAGRLSAEAVDERLRRLRYSYHYERLGDADLVIEAVFEEIAAKQEVFRNLSGAVRRDCILASNTSRLDINRLADMVDAPERVVGLHFFSPAHVMRLLEIVRGDRTLPEVIVTALALAARLRKQPVVAGVCDGFIGNRILSRWWAQCDFALEDGAFPEEVDAALEAYGFAMGPFAVADLAGLDIAWAGRKASAATRDARARDVKIIDWLCEMGRFGQKTGAGWYRHEGRGRVVDPLVHQLVERASAERGIARRKVPGEEICARVLAAMVNEGAKILAEGIAYRPSDIDVVLVHGYGYPAWRGGPMHEADRIGLGTILETVKRMEADGPDFAPAPLLLEMVAAGRNLAALNG
jgi:3-hydroxyacyl-CoA dehydrogenase